jgi:hypothetical protein
MNYGYEEKPTVNGVYNVRGTRNESKATIIPVGLIDLKPSEYIADTFVERFNIFDNVFGEIYLCNITDVYLMSTKKQPVIYLSVMIDKSIKRVYLLKLYLYFIISSEIKDSKDLINKELDGTFSMELIIDDKNIVLDKDINKYPGIKNISKMFVEFIKEEDMLLILKGLVADETEKLKKKFDDQYGNCTIPVPTISLLDFELDPEHDV